MMDIHPWRFRYFCFVANLISVAGTIVNIGGTIAKF